MARANKDHLETLHDYGIHVPSRMIILESSTNDEGEETGVNYFMAMRFLKNFYLLENINKDPITIFLNTNGGDIEQGMAIYDEIVSAKSHVTIIVKGNACSMGSVILQSGDERVLRPHSNVMIHAGSPGHGGGNANEAYNYAKFELSQRKKMDKILYDRMVAKFHKENKTFTKNRFNELMLKGHYMDAQEAVNFGLADRIE